MPEFCPDALQGAFLDAVLKSPKAILKTWAEPYEDAAQFSAEQTESSQAASSPLHDEPIQILYPTKALLAGELESDARAVGHGDARPARAAGAGLEQAFVCPHLPATVLSRVSNPVAASRSSVNQSPAMRDRVTVERYDRAASKCLSRFANIMRTLR